MSKIIPPLLSNSPPPITEPLDDEDDDEFGDFTSAVDLSCNCEALSLPSSPHLSPQKSNSSTTDETLDINSNTNKKLEDFENINERFHMTVNKDYQDKRKTCDTSSILSENIIETEVNLTQHTTSPPPQICINSVNSFEVDNSSFTEKDGRCEVILPNNSVPIANTDEITEINEKANSNKCSEAPTENKIKIDFSVPDCSGFDETEDLRAAVDLNVPCSLNETELLSDPDVSGDGKLGICKTVEKVINEDLKTNYVVEENNFNLAEEDKRVIEALAPDTKHDDNILEKNTTCSMYENQNVPVDNGLYYLDEPPELNIKDDDDEFDDFNYYTSNAYDIDDESESAVDVNELPYDVTATLTEKFDENVVKNKSENNDKILVSKNVDLEVNIDNVGIDVGVVNEKDDISCGDDEQIINETNTSQQINNFIQDCEPKIVDVPKNDDFDDTDFGKFADFTTFESDFRNTPCDDDFGEFNEFQNTKPAETAKDDDFGAFDGDDEFGDFDDYTNVSSLSGFVPEQDTPSTEIINSENVLQKVEKIIVEMFPFYVEVNDEFSDSDIMQDDFVYREIKDITETNALTYQWGKSSSQDNLLNALNIDTRNILYGPGWNPTMPKFAANLSLAPLEPIKPDILTTALPLNAASNSSQSSHSNQPASTTSEVPSAQFDWSGSGLTNPLDYTSASTMLLDIEQLVASLDINNCPTVPSLCPSPVDDFDQWEYWLKSLPKGHQEQSTIDQNRSESIKLRSNDATLESQISSVNQVRTKRLQSDSDSVNSLQLATDPPQDEDNTKSELPTNDDFKEFASYKVSQDAGFSNWSPNALPLRETYISNQHTSEPVKKAELENDSGEPGWLKPTILTPDLPRKIPAKKEFDEVFTNFQSFNEVKEKETSPTHNLEDDFSDFQSVVVKNVLPTNHTPFNNNNNKDSLLPTTSMEPLKPIILQPQVNLETTQINWPDPGITEDDIFNIELNYSNSRAGTELINSTLEHTNLETRKDVNVVVKQAQQQNGIGKDDFKISLPDKSIDKRMEVVHSSNHPTVNQQNISTQNTFLEKQIQSVSKMKPQLLHIETSDLRRNSLLNSNQLQGLTVAENNLSLNNCDDDDEWSDFVCNPEPIQPANQANKSIFAPFMQPERTNTPELQLSVPHLSQLQPPKLPIPVITPHGLIQTKIPSNVPSINTMMQPSVLSNQAQSNGNFQPSIISNQYQNHVSGLSADKLIFSNNHLANTSNFKPYTNGFTQQMKSQNYHKPQIQPFVEKPQPTSKSNDDDDDWTDFISTPPVSSGNAPELNVISKDFDWQSRGPLFNSWSATANNMTPNIITNPVHFDSFRGFIPQGNNVLGPKTNKKVTNVALHSKRTAVPSISALPDLDFVAPRSRTFTKK